MVKMIESIENGEPPEAFNPNMNGPLPPRGEKKGPGWE